MTGRLRSIRGMNDVLPEEAALWLWFERRAQDWLERWGYRNLRTPLVEHTALFRRAIGEATDIVEKEMYSWRDALNAEELTLRPEGTASVVRAAIEHNLLRDGPKRLWYAGPMYRHERPQKGRYRQFHQFGAEALGFAGPDVDAELIVMCDRFWRELGLAGLRLELNSIGSAEERARYRAALVAYLEAHADALDEDSRRRLRTNPLRVLDSKNEALRELIARAPSILDFLGEASRAHFEGLRRLLDAAGVSYTINPRLVRGLDYYNLTVFEWISDRLGAQGTVCGGGRYDGLFALLGGAPTPGAGFALGCERLIALLSEAPPAQAHARPHAYVVQQDARATESALLLADALRAAGYSVVQHAGGGGLRAQMRRADASGALLALILGEDELRAGEVTVKRLRSDGGQARVPRAAIVERFAELLRGEGSAA